MALKNLPIYRPSKRLPDSSGTGLRITIFTFTLLQTLQATRNLPRIGSSVALDCVSVLIKAHFVFGVYVTDVCLIEAAVTFFFLIILLPRAQSVERHSPQRK